MRLELGRLVVASRVSDSDDGLNVDYSIRLTDEAVYALSDIQSEALAERIGSMLGNLSKFPHYGSVYDPAYKSAKPPVACRVFYCGPYGVYYHVDEQNHVVAIIAIEDERRDPMGRFGIQ